MTIGINTSPLAGQVRATQLTARLVQEPPRPRAGRQRQHPACCPPSGPDTWEVQGRGELQLAVLVEMMRREGFELTVGKPQVAHHARSTASCPRAGRPAHHRRARGLPRRRHPAPRPAQGPHGADHQPRHRLGPHGVPRAGPRPDRVPHRVHDRDARHRPPQPRVRAHGSRGPARSARARPARWSPTAPAQSPPASRSSALQDRGVMFVGPGAEVYEGMIVGENALPDDMRHQPGTKEKKLNNIRSSTAEAFEKLDPARSSSLEQALELIARGRVRRGDAGRRAHAQGPPRPDDAREDGPRPRRDRLAAESNRREEVGETPSPSGVGAVAWRPCSAPPCSHCRCWRSRRPPPPPRPTAAPAPCGDDPVRALRDAAGCGRRRRRDAGGRRRRASAPAPSTSGPTASRVRDDGTAVRGAGRDATISDGEPAAGRRRLEPDDRLGSMSGLSDLGPCGCRRLSRAATARSKGSTSTTASPSRCGRRRRSRSWAQATATARRRGILLRRGALRRTSRSPSIRRPTRAGSASPAEPCWRRTTVTARPTDLSSDPEGSSRAGGARRGR